MDIVQSDNRLCCSQCGCTVHVIECVGQEYLEESEDGRYLIDLKYLKCLQCKRPITFEPYFQQVCEKYASCPHSFRVCERSYNYRKQECNFCRLVVIEDDYPNINYYMMNDISEGKQDAMEDEVKTASIEDAIPPLCGECKHFSWVEDSDGIYCGFCESPEDAASMCYFSTCIHNFKALDEENSQCGKCLLLKHA